MGDIVFANEETFEAEDIDSTTSTESMWSYDFDEVEFSIGADVKSLDVSAEDFTISADDIVDELERHGGNHSNENDEISFLEEGSFLVIPE
jgi:hypothetical protein